MGKTTLENIAPDLQILICTFLHPTDILLLRKTCKALQNATLQQRIVWITALHRICLENTLFLPTFPIHDMSNKELEHAAMAPSRWIELVEGLRFEDERHPLSYGKARVIKKGRAILDSVFFLVPGGRYLFVFSLNDIALWDLGYNSCSDITLLASVAVVGDDYDPSKCYVQATSDGKGNISVFDIYPQTKEPQFNQLTHLNSIGNGSGPYCVFPEDCIIWFDLRNDDYDEVTLFFWVWDYKKNLSKSWSFADIAPQEPIVTKTAIALVCNGEILTWHIFPLTTHGPPPHPSRYNNIPQLCPNIRVKIPDEYTNEGWSFAPPSRWYFGSSQPLYMDLWTSSSQIHRFRLEINPQLTDATLHLINTFKVGSYYRHNARVQAFTVCGDTLVYSFSYSTSSCFYGGVFSGTTIPATNEIQSADMDVMVPIPVRISLCPASGRLVYTTLSRHPELTIHDLFPDTNVG